MSNTERLIQEIETLPPSDVEKVVDFVGYLKSKSAKPDYVCPICGKSEHTPNAETIAALEEGDAILRGEIPAKGYHSAEELLAALHG
ncbi:hypothetical protein [Treponema primitia]|uniref:hypothetical protein n=1 Tax=Treponema primitia TaxID=88058 RepID=UPI0002555498|nr:hypothetical protein [Treponema primitia]